MARENGKRERRSGGAVEERRSGERRRSGQRRAGGEGESSNGQTLSF